MKDEKTITERAAGRWYLREIDNTFRAQDQREKWMPKSLLTFLGLGAGYGTFLSAALGLAYLFTSVITDGPSREHSMPETWERLNNQPQIACRADDCDDFEKIVMDNHETILSVAKRTGVESSDIEALMAASYLNPHKRLRRIEGYKGVVPLLPHEVGVSGNTLDKNIKQNLYTAAMLYREAMSKTSFPEVAVALFFSPDHTSTSIGKARANMYICRNDQFGSRDDRYRTCQKLRQYFDMRKWCAELREEIENPINPTEKAISQGRWDASICIVEDRLEYYLDMERGLVWYNNIPDDFAREAVQLFFAYKNAGLSQQDERVGLRGDE